MALKSGNKRFSVERIDSVYIFLFGAVLRKNIKFIFLKFYKKFCVFFSWFFLVREKREQKFIHNPFFGEISLLPSELNFGNFLFCDFLDEAFWPRAPNEDFAFVPEIRKKNLGKIFLKKNMKKAQKIVFFKRNVKVLII